jgi:hypothetical protein
MPNSWSNENLGKSIDYLILRKPNPFSDSDVNNSHKVQVLLLSRVKKILGTFIKQLFMNDLKKLIVIFLAISGVLIFNSCSKEESEGIPLELKTTISDYLFVVNSFSLNDVDELTSDEESKTKSATIASCLTVTINENESGEFWPRNWTLDYGSENCELFSGLKKRGKIHVNISDFWRNESSIKEISFEDYYFNENKLQGIKSILNTGLNENGNLTFTKTISDATVTYANNTSISWNCEKICELTEGGSTFIFAYDVWSVSGSGSGVNLDSKNYTITIKSPLIYNNGCFYPVSGEVEINTVDEEIQTINYGNGVCDNIVSITTGDVTEEIEL